MNTESDSKEEDAGIVSGGAMLITLQELKECLLQVRDLLVFLLKIQWLQHDFQNVVLIGSRIFVLFQTLCPEFCKVPTLYLHKLVFVYSYLLNNTNLM